MNIISKCQIFDGKIILNDKEVFINKNNDTIKDFLIASYRYFNISYPKFFKMDNLSKAGFIASELILKDFFEANKIDKEKFGMIFSNSVSSLDTDINFQETIKNPDNYFPSPAIFVYTLANIVMGEIAIRHSITGHNTFFIDNEFDYKKLMQYTQILKSNTIISHSLCAWIDCIGERLDVNMFLVE
ncbi:hypothetical protein LJC30_01850 [Odoribacter sp. OttesenSCG-928-L07]|nr:hypothetical protein [Odoribacter sp. OttesenSCG-928-L07]MDL2238910.1 3-oxoacyl-ACP synthase [Bacteroidales bacterium OttesenSCG-928-L14]